ncbi:hypothetical protein IEO21_01796 [Rhodonia placenta]|uniref:Uncharacterized protein n=1 Tax=Rhodonia placenta TaxID=104341 RepID=A0A8H7P8X2_9APHY|nr:hypothetical protein IEO21_01796 [Postia placenta]
MSTVGVGRKRIFTHAPLLYSDRRDPVGYPGHPTPGSCTPGIHGIHVPMPSFVLATTPNPKYQWPSACRDKPASPRSRIPEHYHPLRSVQRIARPLENVYARHQSRERMGCCMSS